MAVERFLEQHKLEVVLVISVIYFVGTAFRARSRPFWTDEILTLAAAGQPDFSATLKAARMIDAMPPFTHLILHLVNGLFGTGEVVSRIPGMIGFWVLCLSLFGFAIRRVGMFFALTALLLPFATDSYGYSFEARCYGVLLGFGGLALFCWQSAAAGRKRPLALTGLALAIAGATLSHYYAVLILLNSITIGRRRNAPHPAAADRLVDLDGICLRVDTVCTLHPRHARGDQSQRTSVGAGPRSRLSGLLREPVSARDSICGGGGGVAGDLLHYGRFQDRVATSGAERNAGL